MTAATAKTAKTTGMPWILGDLKQARRRLQRPLALGDGEDCKTAVLYADRAAAASGTSGGPGAAGMPKPAARRCSTIALHCRTASGGTFGGDFSSLGVVEAGTTSGRPPGAGATAPQVAAPSTVAAAANSDPGGGPVCTQPAAYACCCASCVQWRRFGTGAATTVAACVQ